MYIPIARVLGDISAWMAKHIRTATHPTETIFLCHRQGAIVPRQPPPDHVTTTVVLVTSTKFIPPSTTSELKSETTVLPSQTSSIPASTTLSNARSSSSATSDTPEPTGSVITSNPAFSTSSTTSSLVTTVSETIQPTHTSPPPFTKDEGKHIGLVVGLVVGSVVGAILLGLLIYWIYACYRGVNVCNCFGGSEDEDDRGRIQTDQLQPYLMSGIGAAPRIDGFSTL